MRDVRRLPRIPSEYRTDRIYRLQRRESDAGIEWRLREEKLSVPLLKRYDNGSADEWLEANADAGPAEHLSFLGAEVAGAIRAVATWRPVEWNNTLWLVDIRAAAENRRQGLGSALLACLHAEAAALGIRGITVETQTTNYPALRFYTSHGFAVVGFHERLYTDDDLEHGEVALYLFRPVS